MQYRRCIRFFLEKGLCLKDSIDKIGMYVDKQCVMRVIRKEICINE